MKLIIETDIGRDFDDFIALCYLIDAGVDIKVISISPGDSDQVAITKFLLKECGLNVPVGVSSLYRDKKSISGVHTQLLKKYKYAEIEKHDGLSIDLINGVLEEANKFLSEGEESDIEFFGCGPLDSISQITKYPRCASVQGGFVSYSFLKNKGIVPRIQLDKFKDIEFVQTFNLSSNSKAAGTFLKMPFKKRFISKNLCHTIVYDGKVHNVMDSFRAKSRAGEILREAMLMYLKKHPHGKIIHDPTAAICHLHPDIATWVNGRLVCENEKWGTIELLPYNCEIIGDIKYESLLYYLSHGL